MNNRTVAGRNRIIWIVVILAAAFFIFNPFGSKKAPVEPIPAASAEASALAASITAHYLPPAKYLSAQFADHEIVFLGEPAKVKQNVDLVARSIPPLWEHGVRDLGIEYALSSDQSLIDALTTAPTYDPALAKKILFDYLVVWGYQDYADIFKAAWQFNRSRPAGTPPFRIVGLSVKQNWQYLQKEADAKDPAILHRILANGVPDTYMAGVIERDFISQGQKALIYTSTRSAFTTYRASEYAANMKKMGFTDTERAGRIIYDKIGKRAMTVLFHQPWPTMDGTKLDVYPIGGAVDNAIRLLPENERNAGFSISGTPFAALPVKDSGYAKGHPGLTFGDLAGGYIIQGRLGGYLPVTPIPGFITPENIDTARLNFPGPKPGNVSAADLNKFIANDLKNLGRYYRTFE